jgi:hypothetical protein
MSKRRYWLIFIDPKTNKAAIYDRCFAFHQEFATIIAKLGITKKIMVRLPADNKDIVAKEYKDRVKEAINKLGNK